MASQVIHWRTVDNTSHGFERVNLTQFQSLCSKSIRLDARKTADAPEGVPVKPDTEFVCGLCHAEVGRRAQYTRK